MYVKRKNSLKTFYESAVMIENIPIWSEIIPVNAILTVSSFR